MGYLYLYHIKDLKSYCQLECQHIIQSNKFKDDLDYYRGKWLAYIIGIKISNKLILKKEQINKHTLYYHFKKQQNKHMKKRGYADGMYDIMNYISNIDEKSVV